MSALVPLGLAIVAEASWIAVVGWLVQEYALRPATLGIAELAVFVTAGVVIARTVGRRAGGRWPGIAVAVAVAGGAVGWLASLDARVAFAADGLAALAVDPGGWLAGVAVVRGYSHATLPPRDAAIGRLLAVGIPGLAVVSLLGGLVREPFRSEFLDRALVAAVVFVGTGTLALALARLNLVGQVAGFSWRRNPAWTAIVILLVGTAVLVAIPASGVAGTIVDLLVGIALIPMLLLGLTLGFDRAGKALLATLSVAVLVIIVLGRLVPAGAPIGVAPPPPAPVEPSQVSGANTVLALVALIVLAAGVVAIGLLAIAWLRRPVAEEDDVFETRTIDRDVGHVPHRPNRPWFRRRPDPADAASAYVALVEDLAGRDAVARRPAETPAEHAGRLRRVVTAMLPAADATSSLLALDLLAADYGLDRFGGRRLPGREHRRAVGRWRRLRRELAAQAEAIAARTAGATSSANRSTADVPEGDHMTNVSIR